MNEVCSGKALTEFSLLKFRHDLFVLFHQSRSVTLPTASRWIIDQSALCGWPRLQFIRSILGGEQTAPLPALRQQLNSSEPRHDAHRAVKIWESVRSDSYIIIRWCSNDHSVMYWWLTAPYASVSWPRNSDTSAMFGRPAESRDEQNLWYSIATVVTV